MKYCQVTFLLFSFLSDFFNIFTATAVLIYIQRMEIHKIIGKKEGHYVTTGQMNKFQWLKDQLQISAKADKRGCTHLKVDISEVRETGILPNYI